MNEEEVFQEWVVPQVQGELPAHRLLDLAERQRLRSRFAEVGVRLLGDMGVVSPGGLPFQYVGEDESTIAAAIVSQWHDRRGEVYVQWVLDDPDCASPIAMFRMQDFVERSSSVWWTFWHNLLLFDNDLTQFAIVVCKGSFAVLPRDAYAEWAREQSDRL